MPVAPNSHSSNSMASSGGTFLLVLKTNKPQERNLFGLCRLYNRPGPITLDGRIAKINPEPGSYAHLLNLEGGLLHSFELQGLFPKGKQGRAKRGGEEFLHW